MSKPGAAELGGLRVDTGSDGTQGREWDTGRVVLKNAPRAYPSWTVRDRLERDLDQAGSVAAAFARGDAEPRAGCSSTPGVVRGVPLAVVAGTSSAGRPVTADFKPKRERRDSVQPHRPVLSVMLAVPDTPAAVAWYKRALGATVLWSLGSVAGLKIEGAPFFLGQPERNGWDTPRSLGSTTLRVELFCDAPDAFVARAVAEGATGGHEVREHQAPWGVHRQGGFVDPFGHIWFVGDRTPLQRSPR
jgi:PhnB protein